MIDKYGADALRFSLLRLASKGQDIKFSEERVPEARNFANKLWNAARFVLLNMEPCRTQVLTLPKREGEEVKSRLDAIVVHAGHRQQFR